MELPSDLAKFVLTTKEAVDALNFWELNGNLDDFDPQTADTAEDVLAANSAAQNKKAAVETVKKFVNIREFEPVNEGDDVAAHVEADRARAEGEALSEEREAEANREAAAVRAARPAAAAPAPAANAAAMLGGASRANILAQIKNKLTSRVRPNTFRLLINFIIDNAPADIHNGRQIIHVPYSEEILRRLAYAQAMSASGLTASTFVQLFVSQGFKTMPKYKSDEMLALPEFKISPNRSKNWDDAVTKIRNKLATPKLGSGATNFSANNTLSKPNTLTLSTYSRYPAGVQAALVRKRSPPYGMSGLGANYAQGRLSVAVQTGGKMHGGSLGAHAPLFPRVVMNGGSHPLAVLEGGVHDQWNKLEGNVFDPVSQLNTKINKQLVELKGLSNNKAGRVDINGVEIKNYATRVGNELKELRKKLYELNNVNTALAAAPLTDGVNFNFNDLALKGKEINEKAHKVSKGYVNLAAIAEHLEELLNRMKPAELKGGLHDALKY